MTTPTGATVLLVDDDPDIRESLELLLGLHGHAVATAADGAEALDRLRNNGLRPCVILLDLMMPGMNGFQFHQALNADPALASIPVVVITGAGPVIREKAADMKAEVLRKPFELQALLDTVRRFCRAGKPTLPPTLPGAKGRRSPRPTRTRIRPRTRRR